MTTKDEIVTRLIREGHINLEELMVLIAENGTPIQPNTPQPPFNINDWWRPNWPHNPIMYTGGTSNVTVIYKNCQPYSLEQR